MKSHVRYTVLLAACAAGESVQLPFPQNHDMYSKPFEQGGAR
jgi:hypothetical protein